MKASEKSIGKKWGNVVEKMCLVSCVLLNGSVATGAIIEISHIMANYFEQNIIYFKLGIIFVYFFLTAIVIEPEKLKPYAFVSSIVVIVIGTCLVI